jgi:hypothetical protein
MDGGPVPPGNEAKSDLEHKILMEQLGFLKNECAPEFSSFKGRSYIYKMQNTEFAKPHLMEQVKCASQFVKQTGLTKTV